METIVTGSTNPDINEIVRLYAKEKGISEPAAWAAVRNTFVPKSEVLNIITDSQNRNAQQGQGQPQMSTRITDLMAQKADASIEKLKLEFEMRKLELQEKAEAREQRKLEIEEKKLIQEKEIQMRKLELEEKRQQAKEEQESKWHQAKEEQEARRQQSKEEFDQKVLLLQSSQNQSKPNELTDVVKKQGEFYERLIEEKVGHMDEVAKLRVEMESAANKGDTSAQSFIKQMDEYNKMQETVVKSSLGILKARGFSEEQLDAVKQTLEKKEDNTIGKLWEVGKQVWRQIEPQIKVQSPSTPEQQIQIMEQQRLVREQEERMRKQAEEEACRLAAENTVLEQERTELKKIEEANRVLQQKYIEQRNQLAQRAIDLGILLNDQMTNDQIFTAIELREAEVEQRQQKEYEDQQVREREKEREIEREKEAVKAVEAVQEQAPIKVIPHSTEVIEPDVEPEQATEPELELEPEPEPELEPEMVEQGKRQKSQTQKNKSKSGSGKDVHQYTIYKSDGTEIEQVKSVSHKNAGLKVANKLNGTLTNPVRIKVTDESGDQKEYDAYSAEVENRGGTKSLVPRVKAVVVQ